MNGTDGKSHIINRKAKPNAEVDSLNSVGGRRKKLQVVALTVFKFYCLFFEFRRLIIKLPKAPI